MQYESCYRCIVAYQNILEISGGAVNIPLKDGKMINIPVNCIDYRPMLNISEEMSNTGIWKQLSDSNTGVVNFKRNRLDFRCTHFTLMLCGRSSFRVSVWPLYACHPPIMWSCVSVHCGTCMHVTLISELVYHWATSHGCLNGTSILVHGRLVNGCTTCHQGVTNSACMYRNKSYSICIAYY